jgi:hypothetical protein
MDRGCHEEVPYPAIISAIYEAGVAHNEERCYSMVTPIRLNGRELKPHKATVSPLLDARTVLTNSPWEFVSLWLTRQKKTNALFYWNQAQEFARASVGISIQSAPLLHYYSFMNATKALLAAKGVAFTENHGVGADRVPSTSKRLDLANEGVKIKHAGVLPSLATYLGDTETKITHTLQELLFNLPFVHRTYCLTYRNQAELFFTLSDCVYVFNTATKEAYLRAKLSQEFSNGRYLKKLPPAFIRDADTDSTRVIRSRETVVIKSARLTLAADIESLARLNKRLRQDLNYINGSQTLWYAKAIVSGPNRLNRSPLTLTLAAMHRLSEICRYRPLQLEEFLAGQRNWLLSEFVTMAPDQFIDGIAAELTGHQFMLPNVRPAT